MKTLIAPLALLIVAGCSKPTPDTTGSAAAAAAVDGRPDGTIIDGSRPHARTAANAHDKPMDHASTTASTSPQPNDSAATRGYKRSMTRMMEGAPPYTGDADVDFNKQMRIHHLAAVDMAAVQIAQGSDPESKALARKIIVEQRREIAQIDAWLRRRGG